MPLASSIDQKRAEGRRQAGLDWRSASMVFSRLRRAALGESQVNMLLD